VSARTYSVAGMTCSHCVDAVTEELMSLPGVHDVRIDLVSGAVSTVHVVSDHEVDVDQVRAAVDEAGYVLSSHPS